MKKIMPLVLLLLLLPAWSVLGQQQSGEDGKALKGQTENEGQTSLPLTNISIVKLVKAGLREDSIISIINTLSGEYTLDPAYVSVLKGVGVSEKIITAMRNKSANGLTPVPMAPATLAPPEVTELKTGGTGATQEKPSAEPSLAQEVKIPNDTGLYTQKQPCTKVVSFGYMAPTPEGARLIHYNIPDGTSRGWINNWVRKNAKNYPDVCFLPNPMKDHANFMVVLSDFPSFFSGFQATTVYTTSTSYVSGSGTSTDSYGRMWNFTYYGNVKTTTATRENVPYEIHTNVLYANAYNDDGALVSQRKHVYSTQTGGDPYAGLGYNMGNAFRTINAKGRLITSAIQDIAGPARKKAKLNP